MTPQEVVFALAQDTCYAFHIHDGHEAELNFEVITNERCETALLPLIYTESLFVVQEVPEAIQQELLSLTIELCQQYTAYEGEEKGSFVENEAVTFFEPFVRRVTIWARRQVPMEDLLAFEDFEE